MDLLTGTAVSTHELRREAWMCKAAIRRCCRGSVCTWGWGRKNPETGMIRHDNDWPQRTLAWHAKLILEVQQHVLLELELEARVCLRGKGRALLPARQRVEAFTTYAFGCIPRKAITQPATQHDVCRHLNLRSISSCSTMAVLGMQPKAYVAKASTRGEREATEGRCSGRLVISRRISPKPTSTLVLTRTSPSRVHGLRFAISFATLSSVRELLQTSPWTRRLRLIHMGRTTPNFV